jgi:hypothetical protein
MKGLGGVEVRTLGSANIVLKVFGADLTVPVTVVNDDSIQYDIVFGADFLRREKIIVDMNRRKVSRINRDQFRVDYYVKADNSVVATIVENLPVYSAVDMNLCEKGTLVPMTSNLSLNALSHATCNFLYEGISKNEVQGLAGVIK